jgi:RNA polymerase sigma factor (sigma-70 family)
MEKLTEEQVKMTEEHLHLIDYVLKEKWSFVPSIRNDLYQEGYLGLCHAVKNFKSEDNNVFSTYACHIIHGYMLKHYNFKENTDFKVSDSNYKKARLERAIRIDKYITAENGYVLPLIELLRPKSNEIDKFEHEYSMKQEYDRIFRSLSPEEHKFLRKHLLYERSEGTLEERLQRQKTYRKLLMRVKNQVNTYNITSNLFISKKKKERKESNERCS